MFKTSRFLSCAFRISAFIPVCSRFAYSDAQNGQAANILLFFILHIRVHPCLPNFYSCVLR